MDILEILTPRSKGNSYLIGTIESNNPLKVKTGGVQLEREDMYINDSLFPIEEKLITGDKVILLVSNDSQEFILLCKVR